MKIFLEKPCNREAVEMWRTSLGSVTVNDLHGTENQNHGTRPFILAATLSLKSNSSIQ